jgi:hypothetical protein
LPERDREEAYFWVAQRDYARALAACDELAQTYPDLVEAHEQRGWIRASCPDARYRDGKLAVASATRACELTNWKDTGALFVLAAAFAEAGDFAEAVKWQQKVMVLSTDEYHAAFFRDHLALFKAGKPYRATVQVGRAVPGRVRVPEPGISPAKVRQPKRIFLGPTR